MSEELVFGEEPGPERAEFAVDSPINIRPKLDDIGIELNTVASSGVLVTNNLAQAAFTPQVLADALASFLNFPTRMAAAAAAAAALARPHAARELADRVMALARRDLVRVS
jgi:hypothetical protein